MDDPPSAPDSDPAAHPRIEIRSSLPPDSHRWLFSHAAKALESLGRTGEVRVNVVNDDAMSQAHQEFAGIPGTTDVLTFDLSEPGSDSLDADILVCYDEAVRQGATRGHSPERELLLYIIHGILHCLGHDDHDDAAAARMHAEEDRILALIGVGPTYASRHLA